jgi:hypothetical protein
VPGGVAVAHSGLDGSALHKAGGVVMARPDAPE